MVGAAFVVLGLLAPDTAKAGISVAEYIELRTSAFAGDKGAEARWRYYVIGLMDGVQAVQAPAKESGLHFCMPDDLALSPRMLDTFIEQSFERLRGAEELRSRLKSPMAVHVAIELGRAYPCP